MTRERQIGELELDDDVPQQTQDLIVDRLSSIDGVRARNEDTGIIRLYTLDTHDHRDIARRHR